MIFHIRIVFLIISLLGGNFLFAQERNVNYTYSAGAEIFTGFIIKHRDVIGNLITGHPSGFRLVFSRESYGNKAWEQRYNYPTFTATLSYYDLKNDAVLGKVIALNAGLGFHLNDFANSKNDIQLFLGYGIGYFNNPYDPDSNNTNTFISSPLPWNVNLRLGYYRQITDRFMLRAALQFSHFSNGASKVPNYGLNIVNANVGVGYKFSDEKPKYLTDKKALQNYSTKSYFNIDFRMGLTELQPVGSGTMPYYAMSVFWNKRVGHKSIIDVGIEGFMNKSIEAAIKNSSDQVGGEPDYKALGIMLGHELIIEKLAFVTQIGVYLYKPYNPEERIYTKIGLKYYITDHIFGSFILKTHYAVAEVMEFGLGFRL